MNVLIIEDEPVNRNILAGVVETRNHSIALAKTAEEGQVIYQQHKPELILLDLHLPGMNGTDFSNWLRNQPDGEDVYILFITSDDKTSVQDDCLNAGGNDFIRKPLIPDHVQIRLKTAESNINNIRDRREALRKLKESEARFRILTENSRDLVCTHTPDGKLIYVSPSSQSILGLSPEKLVGKTFDDLKSEPNAEPLQKNCADLELSGQLENSSVWKTRHSDGSDLWIQTFTQASTNQNAEITTLYSYSRNVTQQVAEEQQLQLLSMLNNPSHRETFLPTLLEETELRLNGTMVIHIFEPERFPPHEQIIFNTNRNTDLQTHREIAAKTDPLKEIFQPKNAAGFYHFVPGMHNYQALISQPIQDIFGEPLGKFTVLCTSPLSYSERTRSILRIAAIHISSFLTKTYSKPLAQTTSPAQTL